MQKRQFIIHLVDKEDIDIDILELSCNVDDFKYASEILNSLKKNQLFLKLLKSSNLVEINSIRNELLNKKFNNFSNFFKKEFLNFVEEIIDEKKSRLNIREEKDKKNINRKVIGIDLGTTNTLASVLENGKAVSIPMEDGTRLLPSVISINKEGKYDVGIISKNQQIINPRDTFYSIKRFIGRRSHEFGNSIRDNYSFDIDLSDESVGVKSQKLNRRIECEELSAQILKKIKFNAEKFLDDSIDDCIITVPAYFDNNQRNATITAAVIAGFKVQKLISEPLAAALAFNIENSENKSINLVLDLGGGTFDISLVSSDKNEIRTLDVIASLGERDLGGDDYTLLLENEIIKLIYKKNKDFDLTHEMKSYIKQEVIKTKHELSVKEETEIFFPILSTKKGRIFKFSHKLTQKFFEDITKSLTNKLEQTIFTFLNFEKVRKEQITNVICVGGASRMPLFLNLVEEITNITPKTNKHPDEIIASGAAYYADSLNSEIAENIIMDVSPLSLGIETIGNVYSVLIPANTKLPFRTSKNFTTAADYQKQVIIKVFQGERVMASDNIFLGKFILSNIQYAEKRIPQINISFDLDINGILTITAKDLMTNSLVDIKIANSLIRSEEEIKTMIKNSQRMIQWDSEKLSYAEKRNRLYYLKEKFNKIKFPILNLEDEKNLERIEHCLKNNFESFEDPEELYFLLDQIMKKQIYTRI